MTTEELSILTNLVRAASELQAEAISTGLEYTGSGINDALEQAETLIRDEERKLQQ